jgi:carbohydrate-selective porin OprB
MNHARMGRYADATARARASGGTPDVNADAQPDRIKYGFGLNAEMPLADDGDTGLFFRAAWNDGRTQTFMFTEIDRDVSAGAQISGAHWGRDADWVGVGASVNFLSDDHKNYLAAGGTGFMIGDSRINYRPEQIVETYYNFEVVEQVRLSPDYQYVRDPGYNADRGPVHILSIRLRASM